MPDLTARLLGQVDLRIDGRPLEISSAKARGVLCYLTATRQVHSRDRLAGFFWPDVRERNALASLRTALYDLRTALGPDHRRFLLVDKTRIGLRADAPVARDIDALETLSPNASTADIELAVRSYGGPFLDGLRVPDSYDFDDWVFLERERFEHLYAGALCHLAEHCEASGRLDDAVDTLRRVLVVDPLREDVHRQLMAGLARSGRRAEALAQYQACAELLRKELQIEPLGPTQALYRRIRDHEGSETDLPAAPIEISSISRAARQRALVALPANPVDDLAAPLPLVGRAGDLHTLERALARAATGQGQLVVVAGEAGVGKSRLVTELCRGAGDATVLVGHCYESAANQPYGPLAEIVDRGLTLQPHAEADLAPMWLRELARLSPAAARDLPPGENAPLDGVRERDRLFDAVRAFVTSLAAERTLLLVVDDVQWSDETSLSLLAYLARFMQSTRILIVLTARPEELTAERRRLLRGILAHGMRLDLQPLVAEETAALVAAISRQDSSPERFARRLHERTGGNPFFLVETLRALFDQGTLLADDGAWSTTAGLAAEDYAGLPIPDSVGLLLDARLDRLSDEERMLLETAAVLRRDFPFDLAISAASLPAPRALDALDRLLRLGLLHELDPAGSTAARYDFTHALLRERVYGGLSGARRQYLHRQIAGRLEAEREPEPERIAYHYTRGGVRDRACLWSLRAGERALALYAAEDAVAHFRSALELAVTEPETHAALAGTGDSLLLLGRPVDAIESFDRALEAAPDVEARADMHRRIGRAYERQGAFDKALEAYGRARQALRGRTPGLAAVRAADGLATVYVRLGRAQEAVELGKDALVWLESNPDVDGAAPVEAWIRNTLGMAQVHAGAHDEAIPHLEQSLRLKRELGDVLGEAALLNNLGVVHYRLGNDERAKEYYAASLALKEKIGDGYGRAIALTNLALMETHLGSFDQAAEHLAAAESAAGDVNATWLVPEIHRVSAQRYLAVGSRADALREAEEALAAAEELGVPAFIGVAHRVLGLVKTGASGEVDAAEEHFLTSMAVFEMQADEHELAKTRAAYAELLYSRGRAEDAEMHLAAAADVFRRTGAEGRLARLDDIRGRG